MLMLILELIESRELRETMQWYLYCGGDVAGGGAPVVAGASNAVPVAVVGVSTPK